MIGGWSPWSYGQWAVDAVGAVASTASKPGGPARGNWCHFPPQPVITETTTRRYQPACPLPGDQFRRRRCADLGTSWSEQLTTTTCATLSAGMTPEPGVDLA